MLHAAFTVYLFLNLIKKKGGKGLNTNSCRDTNQDLPVDKTQRAIWTQIITYALESHKFREKDPQHSLFGVTVGLAVKRDVFDVDLWRLRSRTDTRGCC